MLATQRFDVCPVPSYCIRSFDRGCSSQNASIHRHQHRRPFHPQPLLVHKSHPAVHLLPSSPYLMEDAWEWQTQPPNDTGKQVRHDSFHIWKLLILGNIGAADCRLMELDTISMGLHQAVLHQLSPAIRLTAARQVLPLLKHLGAALQARNKICLIWRALMSCKLLLPSYSPLTRCSTYYFQEPAATVVT